MEKMKELGCDYIDYPIDGNEADTRILEVKKQVNDAGLLIHQICHLKTLHVHDNNGKEDRHCLPYTGTINWNDFMKSLNETGYSGTLSLECNFLDPLGAFLPGATNEIKFKCFKAIVDGLFAEK